ncbi:MAG: hypothetical protein ACTSW1_16560 [Candidatus Hodarchaeales archaeon]
MLFDFQVSTSGEYQLDYTPSENQLRGGEVNIKVSESFVQSVTGVHESILIIFGIAGIGMSILIGFVRSYVAKHPMRILEGRAEKDITSEVEREPFEAEFEFEKQTKSYDKVQCPTCGNWSDGLYCEECGTYLR